MPILILIPSNKHDAPIPYQLDEKGMLVGRHFNCLIQLDHSSVSRHHAEIFFHEGAWSVHDLNSSNGTYLNGKFCHDENLMEGDILHIGDLVLTFSERLSDNLPNASSLELITQRADEFKKSLSRQPLSEVAKVKPVEQSPKNVVVRTRAADVLNSSSSTHPSAQKIVRKQQQSPPQSQPAHAGLKPISRPPLPFR